MTLNKSFENISAKLEGISIKLQNAFNDNTIIFFNELLSVGEYGVALEILCDQLIHYDIKLSINDRDILLECAKKMEMPTSNIYKINVP